ncbi:hypothetical protein BS50DRAFT_572009 [Corynespora cassiicola Philippines]|uniref:Uncharacterized protein n=1 Tax=Corynespora cassiicola Philippines TaxID=1448308 RepID=A0A2T2NTR5_CORCC|nr:hypothetical protein BS50DRAFT_572009 [Corynespora cassiicola Philippines]
MLTFSLKARYLDGPAIDDFLITLFGPNMTEVRWTRGRYEITIPRQLTSIEHAQLKQSVQYEHYQ